jgi:hypothetical protein
MRLRLESITQQLSAETTPQVLGARDRLQVSRVDATPHSAKMVDV